MEFLEHKDIEDAVLKPSVFLRYIYDSFFFLIWPHSELALGKFLNYFNGVHPKIKFTMEIENSEGLPFLDVLVNKRLDGTLGHRVY